MEKKVVINREYFYLLTRDRITIIEHSSIILTVIFSIILTIGLFFEILPFWGYIIILLSVFLITSIRKEIIVDLLENRIYIKTTIPSFMMTITKRVIVDNLSETEFCSMTGESVANEGAPGHTFYYIVPKNSINQDESIIIQLNSKDDINKVRKVFEQYGLKF